MLYKTIFIAVSFGALLALTSGNKKPMIVAKNPSITTLGLPEIGLRLTSAYPQQTWQEVVITNEGKHHIIGAVIHYELIAEDGSRQVARDVICHPNVSLETNPVKIKELLAKYPIIPPHTSWLGGLGIDRVRLQGQVPPFEETRNLVDQNFLFDSLKSVNITIDGAILEDGQIVGPQKDNPKQWIIDVINEFRKAENGK